MLTKTRTTGLRTVEFPNGSTQVVIGVVFNNDCGCIIEFGIRIDNKEPAMSAYVCEIHRPHWSILTNLLLDPEFQDTPTEEVLNNAFSAMDALIAAS